MERIQAAIQKAKEQRGEAPVPQAQPAGPLAAARQARSGHAAPPGPAWAELAAFEPDPQLMAKHRIVTFADTDPAHTTFDMIRTKILRVLRQNGWTSLGITSPTNGCGKTTACDQHRLQPRPPARRAHGARRPRPAPPGGGAATSASTRPQSMASVLQGTRPIAENFVRYGENLAIGTNAAGMRAASEILLERGHRPGRGRAQGRASSPTCSSTTCRRC